MKPSISGRFVAAAVLATAALGATSVAHASGNVDFSLDVQGGPEYWQPAPLYLQSQAVYIQPPMYAGRPVYESWPSDYGSAYEQERAWRHAEWHRRDWRHHRHDWDRYPSRDDD